MSSVLQSVLSDVIRVQNVLLIVRSNGAVSEIRSNSLGIRQKEKWITIGDNDGPCHMHVNADLIRKAKFVEEQKPGRTSFSVQFFDEQGARVLACFFTKMYDGSGNLDPERKALYDDIRRRYGSEMAFDVPAR